MSMDMNRKMRERGKMNAMRSGLVVVGAIAFGYLTLQLGFRPFLERAHQSLELELQKENEKHLSQSQEQEHQQQPFDFTDSSSTTTN